MSRHVPTLHPISPRSGSGTGDRPVIAWAPVKIALVLLGGAGLGLSATAVVLDRQIDPAAISIGPWVTSAKSGTPDIDPYARAITARIGAITLAAAEGIAFSASTDDTGARLSARCGYRVAGTFPKARYWTLSATTPAGEVMDNAAARNGFSSTEVLRRDKGGFDILATPSVRPGNWLPLSGAGPFVLTLRLYETPLSSVSGEIGKAILPSVTPLGCDP